MSKLKTQLLPVIILILGIACALHFYSASASANPMPNDKFVKVGSVPSQGFKMVVFGKKVHNGTIYIVTGGSKFSNTPAITFAPD